MPYPFYAGACGVYNDTVLLCFDRENKNGCRTWNGIEFTELESKSKYNHWMTYLSTYEDNPFIVGDHLGQNKVKVETLVGRRWNELADYPFGYE